MHHLRHNYLEGIIKIRFLSPEIGIQDQNPRDLSWEHVYSAKLLSDNHAAYSSLSSVNSKLASTPIDR